MSRLRLYARLDARFGDSDEDPRASLVNLVDVMLVFACGLLAAMALTVLLGVRWQTPLLFEAALIVGEGFTPAEAAIPAAVAQLNPEMLGRLPADLRSDLLSRPALAA